jgi:hypothetical protein
MIRSLLRRLAALLCVLPVCPAIAQVPVDLELVLAIDVSGSVDPIEAALQREGYVAGLTNPQVIHAIRSGPMGRIAVIYLEWAGDQYQRIVADWSVIEDERSAITFTSRVAEAPFVTGRWTSISAAIDYSVAQFPRNPNQGIRKVIDVSGDGYNNSGRSVTLARDEAVALGITINGLPILNDRPNPMGAGPAPADLDVYFETYVIGGPGAFMVAAKDFTTFGEAILRKLLLEIAGDTPQTRLAAITAE